MLLLLLLLAMTRLFSIIAERCYSCRRECSDFRVLLGQQRKQMSWLLTKLEQRGT